jgi:hypothetical protein
VEVVDVVDDVFCVPVRKAMVTRLLPDCRFRNSSPTHPPRASSNSFRSHLSRLETSSAPCCGGSTLGSTVQGWGSIFATEM